MNVVGNDSKAGVQIKTVQRSSQIQ